MIKRAQHHFLSLDKNIQGILHMITACFWFALMATMIRHVSQTMPPFEMVFFRNLFSVIIALPWAYKIGFKNIKTTRWSLYIYRTISGVIAMSMLFYSISIIPLTDAIALTFVVPISSTILAIIFLKEKVDMYRWMAIGIGFIGVLFILRPGGDSFHYASLFVLVTAICWSVSNILVKKLTNTDDAKTIVFIAMVMMTPFSLPLAIPSWQEPTFTEILWLIALGWTSNQAQISMAHAYSKSDINVVLPFDFSRLVFITIFAYVFFSEVIDKWTAIGAIIIFTSSVYVARKEKNRRMKKALVNMETN